MHVKLVSYTVPVVEGLKTPGELVAYTARVSNPQNQLNTATADKLVAYLIKHKHWSPFQMVDMTMEIRTTRDIGRQILRHTSFSFQEFSQRYADPTDMRYEVREARLQDTKNRQNSIETDNKLLNDEWNDLQKDVWLEVIHAYNWAIKNGIAKEVARCVLPEGMTPTVFYMKGSLRSWIHYIDVRAHEDGGTQKEHREIARAIADVLTNLMPEMNHTFTRNQTIE